MNPFYTKLIKRKTPKFTFGLAQYDNCYTAKSLVYEQFKQAD